VALSSAHIVRGADGHRRYEHPAQRLADLVGISVIKQSDAVTANLVGASAMTVFAANERMELMQWIADRKVPNPVVLSGDIHSNWVNNLHVDDRKPETPVVATEFVGTSITSKGNGPKEVKGLGVLLSIDQPVAAASVTVITEPRHRARDPRRALFPASPPAVHDAYGTQSCDPLRRERHAAPC